eukprot:7867580-Ditylum_brightwellii.AAC.1
MNIAKLASECAVIVDTCNGTQKTRCLLKNVIDDTAKAQEVSDEEVTVLEVDCWNHLCNVWLGGMTKALSKCLNSSLKGDLESINSNLRNHPGSLLLLVERATGSCQDISVEGPGALYWNCRYWVGFLDKQ